MAKHHVECVYCGVEQDCVDSCRALTPRTGSADPLAHDLGAVPAVDDDAAWAALEIQHGKNCEWIATRAHRRDVA